MAKLSDLRLCCRTWPLRVLALSVAALLPFPAIAVDIPSAVEPSRITPGIEGPREPRPSLDELKTKYGENWGIDQGERPQGFKTGQAPSWEKIAERYHGDKNAMKRLCMPR